MEYHKNDILKIMKINKIPKNIPFNIIEDLFYKYIANINCYKDLMIVIINKMLTNINVSNIQHFNDFLVPREQLLLIDIIHILDNNYELLKLFYTRTDMGYCMAKIYKRDGKNPVIITINSLLKVINYTLLGFTRMIYYKDTQRIKHITEYKIVPKLIILNSIIWYILTHIPYKDLYNVKQYINLDIKNIFYISYI